MKKVKVGLMYSENECGSPLDSNIQFGWPGSINYRNIILELIKHNVEIYNLKWGGVGRDLFVDKMYGLSNGRCLEGKSINYLDVLCFLGFGDISEVRDSDEKITEMVDRLHQNSEVLTINPTETVLRARKKKKKYLIDLYEQGFPIPDTFLVTSLEDLYTVSHDLLEKYEGYVTKPINGFRGFGVEKFPGGNLSVVEDIIKNDSEVLIQGFVPEIYTLGERSLFYFDGELKYTVLKESDEFIISRGDSIERTLINPTQEEEKLAEEVREFVAPESLLARVDLIGDRCNPLLGEVTLSSLGMYTRVFDGKAKNIATDSYWDLIKKILKKQ